MRRDELGILRFRYVRESEFNAIPEQNRDLYTRYVVFSDGSDKILYEYVYGQRIAYDNVEVDLSDYVTNEDIDDIISGKQDKLTAGDNITIDPDTNVISASGGGGHTSDFLNIINLDTSSKEKLTLYVINGQLGYEIEEEE